MDKSKDREGAWPQNPAYSARQSRQDHRIRLRPLRTLAQITSVAISGYTAHPRRSAAHGGELRQAAGAAAKGLIAPHAVNARSNSAAFGAKPTWTLTGQNLWGTRPKSLSQRSARFQAPPYAGRFLAIIENCFIISRRHLTAISAKW
jgi:hypothetical protein